MRFLRVRQAAIVERETARIGRGETEKFSSSAPELNNIHEDTHRDYCELRFDENFSASISVRQFPARDGVKNRIPALQI